MNNNTSWLVLIMSLPTSNATARMRIWRALKSTGCGVLRDGVYLLPESPAAHITLQQQASAVMQAGGTAQVLKLGTTHPQQDITFHALFDRTNEYASLKLEADKLLQSLAKETVTASKRILKRLTREFAALSDIDFFPGPAREQIGQLLSTVTAELAAIAHPDEPRSAKGEVKRLKSKEYQNRTWATRKRLWIDRMASAWLIRRFIDPGAKFLWLNKPQDCPKNTLGFDFDGAAFSHIGSLVTFEVLLASFNLEVDPALERLASLVHFLDVGGIPVAEAHGLQMVLKGMRERCQDDDSLLNEAAKIFDDLYLIYTNEERDHEQ